MPGNPYNAQGMQNALRANPNANFMQNRAQGAPLGALPGMSTTPAGWNTMPTERPMTNAPLGGAPLGAASPPMPYSGDVTQNPRLAGLMEMERRRRMAALMRQRQAAMQGGGMPPQMGGAMRPPMPPQAAAGLANRPPMPAQGMGAPAGRPFPPAGLSNIPPRY